MTEHGDYKVRWVRWRIMMGAPGPSGQIHRRRCGHGGVSARHGVEEAPGFSTFAAAQKKLLAAWGVD